MIRTIPIPKALSAEAQAYLGREPQDAVWPLSPDEWKQMRADLRDGFNAASQSAYDHPTYQPFTGARIAEYLDLLREYLCGVSDERSKIAMLHTATLREVF